MPKFAEVITVPPDDMFEDVLMAAKVVSVSAVAIMTNAIMDIVMDSFDFGVLFPPIKHSCVLNLNKHY
jgi:hypothetical protein